MLLLWKTLVFLKEVDPSQWLSGAGQGVGLAESWPCLETFLVVTAGEVLLASSGWRPGTLPNILQ